MSQKIFLITILISNFLYANTLMELFAQPTQGEKDSVLAHWKSRDVGVYDWNIEKSGILQGYKVDVVSHKVNLS